MWLWEFVTLSTEQLRGAQETFAVTNTVDYLEVSTLYTEQSGLFLMHVQYVYAYDNMNMI